MTNFKELSLSPDYKDFILKLKERVNSARLHAIRSVNREIIELYWDIGHFVSMKEKESSWGSKLIEKTALDLSNEFKSIKGFSKRNIELMRKFSQSFTKEQFAKQAVSQLGWGHIIVLMQKIDSGSERNWYIAKSLENGWSRSVLVHQIESGLYDRQSKSDQKISNFSAVMVEVQSDAAQEMLKDPYYFDFLSLEETSKERMIEDTLVRHINKFLLELGTGFSYMGNQYPINVNGREYRIDMLFYNVRLRSYIVIELKTTEFKPEDAGKLNFYLNAIDAQLKHETDNASIGILICKSRDKVVAEYALKGMNTPMGISQYQLSKIIPKDLEELPTIHEIEEELSHSGEEPGN